MTTEVLPVVEETTSKNHSVLKAFLNGIFYSLSVVCVVLVLAAIVIPKIIGAVPLTVLTGSMEPTFRPGDLLITKEIDPAEVKTGQMITFQPESGVDTLITHRVVSAGVSIGGDRVFVTRGDANNQDDKAIIGDQVMGKYLYHVPYVGFLANSISLDDKPLIMKILGGGFLLWAAIQLVLWLVTSRGKKSQDNQEKDDEDATSYEVSRI